MLDEVIPALVDEVRVVAETVRPVGDDQEVQILVGLDQSAGQTHMVECELTFFLFWLNQDEPFSLTGTNLIPETGAVLVDPVRADPQVVDEFLHVLGKEP